MIDFVNLRKEYKELSSKLASPEVFQDREKYQTLVKRFTFLEKILALGDKKDSLLAQREEFKRVLEAPQEEREIKEIVREELPKIEEEIRKIEEEIEEILFEEESQPQRDVIMEIRSAAGGEEAALFAADLFRMYCKYLERKGWQWEILSSHPTEIGGYKEIVFAVKGKGSYTHLKFERGVHRVQRIPVTEAGGRIHTSTATVAVLVEPQEVELKIAPEDLKIETFRASGHGGQHVNVTDSAVRITHLPTGIVVSCQDERSQIKNREKAMRVIKARIMDRIREEEEKKLVRERKHQIGTGERSEKIRTYNFPEHRVTDHRINLTLYRLQDILEGDLDKLIGELIREERKRFLREDDSRK